MTMNAQQPQQQQQPHPPPQTHATNDDGFELLNPTLPVFAPRAAGQQVRGFIMGRQLDPNGDAFYVLQLTAPCEHALTVEGACAVDGGEQLAVYETDSIKGCAKFMPNLQPTADGQTVAHWACEVIFETLRHHDAGWHYIARGRHVRGAPIGMPAKFSLPDVPSGDVPKPALRMTEST